MKAPACGHQPNLVNQMIYNLHTIRFFAALSIFLFHLHPYYHSMGGSGFIAKVASNLYFGTDIFRVLSAFILTYITVDKHFTLRSSLVFCGKRFIRIFSSYWVFALLTAFVFYFVAPEVLARVNWLRSITLTSIDLSQLIIPLSWSLSYELYFYLIFSVFLLVGKRFRYVNVSLIASYLVITAFWFTREDYQQPAGALGFWLSPYLLEFIAGMLLCHYRESLRYIHYRYYLTFALLLFVFAFDDANYRLGLPRALLFSIFSVLIVAGLYCAEVGYSIRLPSVWASLGRSAYILFLAQHGLIYCFFATQLPEKLKSMAPVEYHLSMLMIIVLTLLGCHAYYKSLDIRMYRWLIGIYNRKTQKFMSHDGE